MKTVHTILLAVAATATVLFSLPAHAAAGRVLIAAGDVVAVREGRPVTLIDGSVVEAGDTIQVGERSSVQLLMRDKAVLALRANSSLTLESYQLDEKGTNSQSFLTLLKGGLRAVTGLIGKRNNANFRLTTPTSTIGIRGTNFTVVQCAGNCQNADGSKAPDGMFGGVSDGRIVVSNAAGNQEFRKNQYFYVANRDTAIRPLPEPPVFLRDPQDARGRAKTSVAVSPKTEDKPPATAAKEEPAAAPTASAAPAEPAAPAAPAVAAAPAEVTAPAVAAAPAEVSAPAVVAAPAEVTAPVVVIAPPVAATPAEVIAPTVVSASASNAATVVVAPAGVTTGTAPVNNAPVVSGVAYSVSEAFTNGAAVIGQQNVGFGLPPVVQTSRLVPVLEYRLAAQSWTLVDNTPITNADGSTTPETTVNNFTKTASVGVGSSASAGNVSWGQYILTQDIAITEGPDAGQTFNISRTRHWAIGDGVEQLPTSGSYTYNWVGGTTPTDLTAPVPNAGTLISGGAIGVRFDDQTMSTLSPIQWSMPTTGSSYAVSFQNAVWTPVVTDRTDPSDGSNNRNVTYPLINAPNSTCTGCTNLAVSVSPTFFGKTGQGLGLAISTRATVAAKQERTATTQVYQRP